MGAPVTTRYYQTANTFAANALFGTLDTIAPIGATTVFGWNMGSNTSNTPPKYCQKQASTEVARTSTMWTVAPTGSLPNPNLGDGWIIGPFNGIFNSGNWQVTMSLRSVSNAGAQLGRLVYKVYSAVNPSIQSTYSSLTTNWASSSITPSLATTNIQQRITASVTLPQIRLQNEYVVIREIFHLTTVGGNTNADADWSYGSTGGSITASILTTPFSQTPPSFINWIQEEFS